MGLFKKKVTKRYFCIGDKVIPQMYNSGYWKGINKEGELWATLESQIKYCGLDTMQEAVEFLQSIQIKDYYGSNK